MHSVNNHRSKYFATVLTTGVGNANPKSEMEVKDCSPEVLTCAVDFMYGNPIPEDFADTHGLVCALSLCLGLGAMILDTEHVGFSRRG